jgi:MerR family transcriptional regulator, light-induced transcriptional regulator
VSRASRREPSRRKANEDDSELPRYTVRVVAERVGVPIATLRSWNQRYGVGPPDHSPGRHRLYSETYIATVQQMHALIGQGASPGSAARAAIDSVRPARGDTAPLLSAALDLDAAAAGRLLDRHLRHFGVLDTWNELVRPAFAAIEAKQAQGEGCIDVEHALSWTVSRSLQRLPIAPPDAAASIILACTAGEAHTLALEALRAALGERGCGALMLGADVPLVALVDAVQRRERPVTAVLWSQAPPTADAKMVEAVVAADAEVIVGGPGWESTTVPRSALRIGSLDAAVHHFVPDR